jgi:hypothetical protein
MGLPLCQHSFSGGFQEVKPGEIAEKTLKNIVYYL